MPVIEGPIGLSVGVAAVGDAAAEFILPSSVEAQQTTPIYPRVNGYVKTLNVDIGARVKAAGGATSDQAATGLQHSN